PPPAHDEAATPAEPAAEPVHDAGPAEPPASETPAEPAHDEAPTPAEPPADESPAVVAPADGSEEPAGP
ncbi:MAG: hypothetical protein D6683_01660, partial [Actinomyces sp.]